MPEFCRLCSSKNNSPKSHCDLIGLLIKTSIQSSHEIKVWAEFGASPEENLKPWIYRIGNITVLPGTKINLVRTKHSQRKA
jgi:hypothetical protein